MVRTASLGLPLLLLTVWCSARGQQDVERYRRESIESILRIQDLRTPYNERLIAYLSDGDHIVRERATLACGSIQDTALLPLLVRNLTDADPTVQFAAAFAIGQTGTQLSPGGCARLEHDLIWKRLDQTAARERLIEEIGKFGTAAGLADLMIRVGNVPPFTFNRGMTMCIARFAIRGIISDDGVRYLLNFLRPPESTPWETVYALQRIGSHPLIQSEVEQLALLEHNRDPRVRMHLATLLGKLHDTKVCFSPLARLAEFDRDWRVRVNALRAIALYPLDGQGEALATLAKSFYDPNKHIALTGLSAIGTTRLNPEDTSEAVVDIFARLRSIAENRDHDLDWQVEAEAAKSLARLAGPPVLPLVAPTSWPEPRLQAQLLEAVALTGAAGALSVVLPQVNAEQPITACAALEALRTLTALHPSDTLVRRETYASALDALRSTDVATVTTAASLLGDSLLRSGSSAVPLMDRLRQLRAPDDVEAMQEIAATLGKLQDPRAIDALMDALHGTDRSVAIAARDALRAITGLDYSDALRPWYQPVLTDFDFNFLHSLPGKIPVRLETSKGNVLIELDRDAAPFTIMSVVKLATQRGFYRGLLFHRVVANFVVQGGDPRGDGWGGPGYSLRSEFSPLQYETGTVGIASAGKDTEGSQFFITHSPQPHLDGRYTIIGKVVEGMDVVDRLQVGDRIFDFVVLPPTSGREISPHQ